MRYGAAYLLAALSGSAPSAKDIEKILGSVGIDCDAAQAKIVVQAMEGKKVEDVIAQGMEKIGGLLAGGGGGGGGSGAAAPAAGGAPAAAAAAVEEKKPEEPEEESDDDMGFGLFD